MQASSARPKAPQGTQGRIVANIMYNYELIKTAAKRTQEELIWQEVPSVQALRFSNHWVHSFLQRAGFRRRKITREDKKVPSLEEIWRIMGEGQAAYINGQFVPVQVLNMDETAFNFALGPLYMYIPTEQKRAHDSGATDAKARITAIVTVDGLGEFLPLIMIVKCSKSSSERADQTSMRVLDNLQREVLTRQKGWDMHIWENELTLPDKKGQLITKTHRVKYLRHTESGHIVTSQHKAWNDTVRICMWIDLVLKPGQEARGGKVQLWMDNCSCHITDVAEERMRAAGVVVSNFPPNMTAVLQVLDLVVNGPIKRHIRSWTADEIAQAFREYQRRWRNMESGLGKFCPPKAKVGPEMEKLFELVGNGEFAQQQFADTIKASFVKCGLTPSSGSTFEKFEMKELSGIVLYPTASASAVDYSVVEEQVQQAQVESLLDDLFVHGVDDDIDSDSDSDMDEDEEEEEALRILAVGW